MINIIAILLVTLLLSVVPVIAVSGTGHDHGHSHEAISVTEAKINATQRVKHLVDTKKIDTTWEGIEPSSIKQEDYGHGPEWVIIFKNDKVKDISKKTLYLFLTQDGNYLAANYDGS